MDSETILNAFSIEMNIEEENKKKHSIKEKR